MPRDYSTDVAVVSWNANGFWQADLFMDWAGASWRDWMEHDGVADDFFTLAKDGTEDQAKRRAAEKWPGCEVTVMQQDDEGEDEHEDCDCGEDTCCCAGQFR